MKRGQILGIFVLVLLVSAGLVAAGPLEDFTTAFNTFTNSESVKTLLTTLLGGPGSSSAPYTGDILFVKVLIFILLLAIVHYAAGKVPQVEDSRALHWTITIVVSLLSIRFMTSSALIEFIWLPNGVLGVTLAAFFPFVIYFFFIESFDSSILRKVGWIAFFVIYMGLGIYRYEALAIVSGTETSAVAWNLAWLYIIVAILSLIAILLDKPIKTRLVMSQLKLKQNKRNIRHLRILLDELDEQSAASHDMRLTEAQRNAAGREVTRIRREISEMEAES